MTKHENLKSVQIKNEIPLEGILRIEKRYADKPAEEIYHEKNLIVLAGKQYILSALYSTGTFNRINSLHVGIGGTIDPEGKYVKQTNTGLTNLYTPLLTVPVAYVQNTTTPSTTFVSDLDQATGNGSLITEAGLFQVDGTMFNIKTFPGIPKTSEFSLHFEWTVKVA